MGGGKRKYAQRQKYVPKDKKLGKYVEEKKEVKEEDVKKLLKLWQSLKKE